MKVVIPFKLFYKSNRIIFWKIRHKFCHKVIDLYFNVYNSCLLLHKNCHNVSLK